MTQQGDKRPRRNDGLDYTGDSGQEWTIPESPRPEEMMPDAQSEVGLPFHPYADLFPLLEGQEFDDLVTDIEQNGLQHPITLLNGKILDGRNRYRACLDAMVPIKTAEYAGKQDPLAYVISVNLQRRHMTPGQRAWVAEKLETLKQQGRPRKDATAQILRADAAKIMSVSERSIADAKTVRELGVPELGKRVEAGKVAITVAAKVARMPREQQAKIANLPEPELRGAVKKVIRDEREKEFAKTTKAASEVKGTSLYNVIYADPPWRFLPYSEATGMDRAADNHYPTMTVEDIIEIKVPAAKDCVLFLWATAPMLLDALDVMLEWGFDYKSHYVWVKDRIGTGYWARNKHELLLIGVKGTVPAPAPGEQFDSVVAAAVARHSQKPFIFAEMIEEMFPNASLLEMFARAKREGWTSFGNEIA